MSSQVPGDTEDLHDRSLGELLKQLSEQTTRLLGADDWFTGWPDGQPASVGNANPRRPAAGQPYSARPHLL
jgi:hypothetical protein